jgi:hypothetical protein
VAVGAQEYALGGLGTCPVERPRDARLSDRKALLLRAHVVELERRLMAVVSTEDASAPSLCDQDRLHTAPARTHRLRPTPEATWRAVLANAELSLPVPRAAGSETGSLSRRRATRANGPESVLAEPTDHGARAAIDSNRYLSDREPGLHELSEHVSVQSPSGPVEPPNILVHVTEH